MAIRIVEAKLTYPSIARRASNGPRLLNGRDGQWQILRWRCSGAADPRVADVGHRLLEAVEAKGCDLGCCKLTLEVMDKNDRAMHAYEAAGFLRYAPWKMQVRRFSCRNCWSDPMRIDQLCRFLSRSVQPALLTLSAILLSALPALAEPMPGSLPAQWNIGAADCAASAQPPLQVHKYEPQTFILRQSPCADFEANFIYLLIGSDKALLIDTGAVADPKKMPLAKTVLDLLPEKEHNRLPLLVAHTHRHMDHRAGDPQFAALSSVQVVPFDLEGMQGFFGFTNWPNAIVHIDLGGRTVNVIPTPGHNPTHVAFYDDRTGILFSGDFLLPGRLLIEDAKAYRESAVRAFDFLKTRPLTHILGGHIELNAAGRAYRFGSHYHPNEHRLELARVDLEALPAAFDRFNGFYARYPNYILTNPIHNILALSFAVLLVLSLAVFGLYRLWRRRRRRRRQA